MTSDDIKTHPDHSDPAFDALLRQQLQAGQAYLPDDGFSIRIMSALPKPRATPWREWLMIGLPVLLISLVVFAQLPWSDMGYIAWTWVREASLTSWMGLGAGMSLLGALLAGAWYWRMVDD